MCLQSSLRVELPLWAELLLWAACYSPLLPGNGEWFPHYATHGNFFGNLSKPVSNFGERAASESSGLKDGAWKVVPLG